jgi:hypothetical protein
LVSAYLKEDLPQPWSSDYESQFEKEVYMALNYFRKYPKKLVPHVKQCKTVFSDELKNEKEVKETIE